jgi:hypothetical protein
MFNDLKMRLVNRYGELEDNPGTHPRQLFALTTETLLHEPFMKLRISATTMSKRPGIRSAELQASTELLASNWGIGREAAERTLRATTRRGVHEYDGNEIGVERRFPAWDRHLRYNRLIYSVYHDTLFTSIKSTRGNKRSQVYATDFCWSRNFPMKSKNEINHTLDDFFHRYMGTSKFDIRQCQGTCTRRVREESSASSMPYRPNGYLQSMAIVVSRLKDGNNASSGRMAQQVGSRYPI